MFKNTKYCVIVEYYKVTEAAPQQDGQPKTNTSSMKKKQKK